MFYNSSKAIQPHLIIVFYYKITVVNRSTILSRSALGVQSPGSKFYLCGADLGNPQSDMPIPDCTNRVFLSILDNTTWIGRIQPGNVGRGYSLHLKMRKKKKKRRQVGLAFTIERTHFSFSNKCEEMGSSIEHSWSACSVSGALPGYLILSSQHSDEG